MQLVFTLTIALQLGMAANMQVNNVEYINVFVNTEKVRSEDATDDTS